MFKKKQGYTLAELLVVVAILGIIATTVIPSMVRFYKNATDPVKRSARSLSQIMQVARMYAMTYHVNTGVVYRDDYVPVPLTNLNGQQGIITGPITLHALVGASVMYEISRSNNEEFDSIRNRFGFPESWDSFYVPIESRSGYGEYVDFEAGVVLTYVEIKNLNIEKVLEPVPVLYSLKDKCENNLSPTVINPELLGLRMVNVPFLNLEYSPSASAAYNGEECEIVWSTKWFAHIFSPTGRLLPAGDTKERYKLAFVDITNAEPVIVQEEIQLPDIWVTHRISSITLYRVTGRIQADL